MCMSQVCVSKSFPLRFCLPKERTNQIIIETISQKMGLTKMDGDQVQTNSSAVTA